MTNELEELFPFKAGFNASFLQILIKVLDGLGDLETLVTSAKDKVTPEVSTLTLVI